MLIVASLCWIAFGILGIKYFILLGLVTALFNIVPYVGIFTALLLSTLITFATTGASVHLVLVIITIVAIHLIDSNVLLPLIVGSKVSINAMVTVIGVVAGEMLWGHTGYVSFGAHYCYAEDYLRSRRTIKAMGYFALVMEK